MKKTLAVLILLLTAISVFALDAKVLDVVGKVEVQNASGAWDAVTPGAVLAPGAVLSTGFKSEAVLSIDESTITVKALTRLTVEKLYEQEGNKSSSFYLDAGALAADVKSAENKKVSFTVKTPAVTASVRGTAGDLTVDTLVGSSGTWLLRPPEPKAIDTNRGDAKPAPATVGVVLPEAPVVPAGDSGSTEESSDFDWSIGNGDVTVKPGQEATFSVGQDIVTPMQTAAAAATSTGGTQTLSAQEAVASTAAPAAPTPPKSIVEEPAPAPAPTPDPIPDPTPDPPGPPNPPNPPDPPAEKKGSISITLKWPSFN